LTNYSKEFPGPAIDAAWFVNAVSASGSAAWSSNGYASSGDFAWSVGFDSGGMNFQLRGNFFSVRLVRGNPYSAGRYSASGNGAEVADAATGLVWRRCVEGMLWNGTACTGTALLLTHEQALARARDMANWRLPNIKELESLVDRRRINPSIDPAVFPATPASEHWSSTGDVRGAQAWMVDFRSGRANGYVCSICGARGEGRAVRLVRASQ
jgi:hypothetical protein